MDFVAENLGNLEEINNIINYCDGIAKRTISIDRYSMAEIAQLATTAKQLYRMDLNPLGRP
jgi:hypothetical protein